MSGTSTPIFAPTINNTVVQITNASGTTGTSAFSSGTEGGIIESWLISSTDTVARDIAVSKVISAVTYPLGVITIPANAGNTNGIPPVDMLKQLRITIQQVSSTGSYTMVVGRSATLLQINAVVTITSGKTITSIVQSRKF